MSQLTAGALARMIDHTILKPDATADDVARFCAEAREHRFASVCVNPARVSLVAAQLAGSDIATCAVVAFPFGAIPSRDKAREAESAISHGAREIDMVIHVGALRDGAHDLVRADIAAVRAATAGQVLKVIIETCLLDDAQKRVACELAADCGADFVKTSTGYGTAGATEADVALMRATVGPAVGVKASGGIRSFAAAAAMVAAGANRIGASASVAIIGGAPSETRSAVTGEY